MDVPEVNIVSARTIEYLENDSRRRGKVVSKSLLLSRAGVTILTYPLDFVKTLMQIGYEPYPPRAELTLLGRRCLLLQNSFEYVKYVKNVDGFFGCFRGLGARLVQQSVYLYSSHLMKHFILQYHYKRKVQVIHLCTHVGEQDSAASRDPTPYEPESPNSETAADAPELQVPVDAEEIDDGTSSGSVCDCPTCEHLGEYTQEPLTFFKFLKAISEDWCCRMVGLIASFPFQVIAVRAVAEFVGNERDYSSGIFKGLLLIYRQDGILGFYTGLIPKMIGESVHLVSCGLLRYLVGTQVWCPEFRACLSFSTQILVGSLTYPFTVVSNTMIVSGARSMVIGRPPLMPIYKSWLDCWAHLSSMNQLRRGSSMMFRYYTGPKRIGSTGAITPVGVRFGPDRLRTQHIEQ